MKIKITNPQSSAFRIFSLNNLAPFGSCPKAVECWHRYGCTITCDALTDETTKSHGCACTTFPCCCTNMKLADSDRIEEIGESSSETLTRQISLCSVRPDFNGLLGKCLNEAQGKTGVAVCGPLGMSRAVRWTVASASDARAVHKGSSAEGIYLHVEGFGFRIRSRQPPL
jgi:ferric-chelate reductase